MVLLFSDQLGDEPAPRVWCRGVIDLAISVPTRHLEAHMNRPPNSVITMIFGAVTIASILVAAITGTNPSTALGALAVGAVAGILTVASARQTRTITAATSTTSQWWKLLAVGAGGLFAMLLAEGATDLDLWMPMVITVLVSLLVIAAGLVLGVAHLLSTHPRRSAT
jgi:hypothetical protein